jgi:hypothetical protein
MKKEGANKRCLKTYEKTIKDQYKTLKFWSKPELPGKITGKYLCSPHELFEVYRTLLVKEMEIKMHYFQYSMQKY